MESEARLGRYDILALLGRGGMGEVYLAAHRGPSGFAKLVVLKILRSELIADDAMLAMFEEEARVSAQLIHPNIAQTLELCVEEAKPYLVMEYLDGQALSTVFRRLTKQGQTMSVRALAHIIVDVLNALEYAHTSTDLSGQPLNLVHRDVSPQNIFVTYAGQAKLLDFGIAKAVVGSENTKTGILKGKVAYMAPEQALGAKVDCRADIFSLGMVLLQGLTGKKPWSDTDDMKILLALASGIVPSPADLVAPEAPRALVDICTRALAANRENRYSSAREMRLELEEFLASSKEAGESDTVARFVEKLFLEERAEKRALIESKLKELKVTTPPEGHLSSRRLKVQQEPTNPTPSPAALPSPPAVASKRGPGRVALLATAAGTVAAVVWIASTHLRSAPPPAQSAAAAVAVTEGDPHGVSASVSAAPAPPSAPSASASAVASASAAPVARPPKHSTTQTASTTKHHTSPARTSGGPLSSAPSNAFDLGSQE